MAIGEYTAHGRSLAARLAAAALRIAARIHVSVYRRTGGAIGGRIYRNRLLLLTATGRKTGWQRTTPVAYLADGDAVVIVGGAAGAAQHPAWWLNLMATPVAQIQIGRRMLRVRAAEATPEEQRRLWARYPAQRARLDSMQRRVPRAIPVVVLRPIEEQ
jgi:deazaflavin-dependent oxidoreductase (nitroreductase family)